MRATKRVFVRPYLDIDSVFLKAQKFYQEHEALALIEKRRFPYVLSPMGRSTEFRKTVTY